MTKPDSYTAAMSKAKQRDRIFIDYRRGGTAILRHSARARPGEPFALPVNWDS